MSQDDQICLPEIIKKDATDILSLESINDIFSDHNNKIITVTKDKDDFIRKNTAEFSEASNKNEKPSGVTQEIKEYPSGSSSMYCSSESSEHEQNYMQNTSVIKMGNNMINNMNDYDSVGSIVDSRDGGFSINEINVSTTCGSNTNSSVICLEEGIADDDSWVEEVSHDEGEFADDIDMEPDDFDMDFNNDNDDDDEDLASLTNVKRKDLRTYNRTAIDFSLHTIIEESCEEGDIEPNEKRKSRLSASELEKYFSYGLVNGKSLSSFETKDDSTSEVSSICSESMELLELSEDTVNYVNNDNELASSRLEKYFLTGFMGFTEQNQSDESGSVGSDSDGYPSPGQRRKRLVRARGSQRSRSSSLDNLLNKSDYNENGENNQSIDSSESETFTEVEDHYDKMDANDTLKRKKQSRKRQDSDEKKMLDTSKETEENPHENDNQQTEFLSQSHDNLIKPNGEHSRDSGFIGSNDDLLRNEDIPKSMEKLLLPEIKESSHEPVPLVIKTPAINLLRKDSFNNWSSDEDTNLMMTKMRQFFKNLVANSQNMKNGLRGSTSSVNSTSNSVQNTYVPRVKNKSKPVQLTYFESELTRLMKTVPGINDEQVREIVEYLSSEDTWSDSYDSSDYTSSELDEAAKKTTKAELKRQISASCRQIIKKFDNPINDDEGDRGDGGLLDETHNLNPETALVYQKLVASFSQIATGNEEIEETKIPTNSPQLLAKVMHHIGTRLVALMHEVSSGESYTANSPVPPQRYRKKINPKCSPKSIEDDENTTEHNLQKAENLNLINNLPRSKSHDILNELRPLQSNNHTNENVGEEKEFSDYERFSWRGSFESALLANADSRTKLSLSDRENSTPAFALTTKRRSASDLLSNNKSMSREQLDRVRSCGSIGGNVEDTIYRESPELWESAINEEINYRRSSVPDAVGETENLSDGDTDNFPTRSTLPRSLQSTASTSTNSLPRLPNMSKLIQKSQSVYHFLPNRVKSARYRPPGLNIISQRLNPIPRKASSTSRLQHIPFVNRDSKRKLNLLHNVDQNDISTDVYKSALFDTPVTSGTITPLANEFCSSQSEDDINRLMFHQSRKRSVSLGGRTDSLASIYSDAGEGKYGTVAVKGHIEFGMQYNYKHSALEVRVVRCKDLAAVDIKKNRSDPYVKVYLLPDKSKNGKRKTKIKKHTLNPVFDETLKFQLPLSSLDSRTLWLTVWHSDMFGRNDFLGEVIVNLQGKVFDNPRSQWYPLQERSEALDEMPIYKGDIIVGLKFISSENLNSTQKSKGRLHVLVKEAKNLSPVKSSGTCDAFCKSYLLPDKARNTKQKTPVVRRSNNPIWNYTFIYENVSLQELSERALELTIWDHDRLASNEFLGGVRFSLGTGKHHGKTVNWMDAKGKELSLWENMLNRPNFWVEGGLILRSSLDGVKMFS